MLGCGSLPPAEGRIESHALSDTEASPLGRAVAPLRAAHPGKSGIHPLSVPSDAFAARVLLAHQASRSLDMQYYIWHGDTTGELLFESAWRAAERGVRVRLLLDDNNTAGLDQLLATLDAHPNIELRLYNPLVQRQLRALNFVFDFARVNRRMHNKAFIVDNQVAVVGGRNLGDEYFGAGNAVVFADLDVVAVGAVVPEVSKAFDLYWNSPSAYPAAMLLPAPPADGAARLEARFAATHANPDALAYLEALRSTPLVRELLAGQLPFEWTDARVLQDDPAKTLDAGGRTDVLLLAALLRDAGRPASSLDLVSPYFVPGKEGTEALADLARSGVRVRVLTNSLAATDVTPVHAGYTKRREELLRAGVQLFELKRTAGIDDEQRKRRLGGSSGSSLHAKTFAIDGQRVFVGSFNFDPRSALLNTEMGLLIDSPVLARNLSAEFDGGLQRAAYQVQLGADGRLEWVDRGTAGEVVLHDEPGAGVGMRAWIGLLSVLPIEWLL